LFLPYFDGKTVIEMFYLSVKIDEPAVIEDLHIKQEELNLR
jgi:hypothetical protein